MQTQLPTRSPASQRQCARLSHLTPELGVPNCDSPERHANNKSKVHSNRRVVSHVCSACSARPRRCRRCLAAWTQYTGASLSHPPSTHSSTYNNLSLDNGRCIRLDTFDSVLQMTAMSGYPPARPLSGAQTGDAATSSTMLHQQPQPVASSSRNPQLGPNPYFRYPIPTPEQITAELPPYDEKENVPLGLLLDRLTRKAYNDGRVLVEKT